MELTRRSSAEGGRHIALIEFGGREVRAYDDAIAALRVAELCEDPAARPADRRAILPMVMFPDRGGGRVLRADGSEVPRAEEAALVTFAAWELYGFDFDGSHAAETGGPRVVDWRADAAFIKASLFQTYGAPWEELAGRVSYRDMCGMVGLLPPDTPMGRAIYYRTAKPPREMRGNREAVREFRRMKRLYALDSGGESAEAANNAASDVFASLRRAARG